MRRIFVDPGFGGTGYAVFSEKVIGVVPPVDTGVLRPVLKGEADGAPTWMERAASLWNDFEMVLTDMQDVSTVVFEFPELWSGSATSHASATARKKGEPPALHKLVFLIGGFASICEKWGVKYLLVTPGWKGQLPKKVVHLRLLKAYKRKYREHEADAVGMGLAWQGGL